VGTWRAVVKTAFEKALKSGGSAYLADELHLELEKPGGTEKLTLPAGTELFFALSGGPMTDRKKATRSPEVCSVMCSVVHMTLNIGPAGVVISSFRRMQPRILTPA
jgi:hypothetical protein